MKKRIKIWYIKMAQIIGIERWKDNYTTNEEPKEDDYEIDFGGILKIK